MNQKNLKRSVPPQVLNESIEVHETLNPKIWNNDNTIKPEVYQKLKNIADEFLKYIEIPLNIVDIEIVGSNASYNYNENSDIDLHIIVNNEVNYVEPEILRQLYNSKKNSFNDHYNLDIDGIPIELYIEDVKDGNATNGRYSILKQEWVLFPQPIKYDIPDISADLEKMWDKYNEVINGTDPQKILDFVNEIYMMRKLGLATDGEASVGNLVFKELRNADVLTKLKEKYYELRSAELNESKDLAVPKDKSITKNIDELVSQFNGYGLSAKKLTKLLDLLESAIDNDSYDGKLNIKQEYGRISKFVFFGSDKLDENKDEDVESSMINQLMKNGMTAEQAKETYRAILNIFKNKEKNLLKTEDINSNDWDNNFVIDLISSDRVYWLRKSDGKTIETSLDVFKEPTDVTEWKSEDELKDYILEEDKKIEESSLSRLYQHTKDKDTFAVIGSQDMETRQNRFNELKSYVSKLREKVPNIGFNYLEGTYTYEDGDQGIENSLIIYNIPKQDALDIAKELNQESIIWKDNNYFGFLDQNGNELDTFKNDTKNMTFDDKITNMFGSRLRSGNTYKPAFAFECKLIETDATGSTFSKQHKNWIKEYPICKINI